MGPEKSTAFDFNKQMLQTIRWAVAWLTREEGIPESLSKAINNDPLTLPHLPELRKIAESVYYKIKYALDNFPLSGTRTVVLTQSELLFLKHTIVYKLGVTSHNPTKQKSLNDVQNALFPSKTM